MSEPSHKSALSGRASFIPLLKIMGGFAVVGSILFLHVWLPIQAERSLVALRRTETQLSQKKSEFNDLSERYASMTSLISLDKWAKKHGPWIPAQANNVLTIEK